MRLLRHPALGPLAVAAAFSLLALGLAACDVDSTDSTTSVISDNEGNIYSYAGLYMNTEEGSTNGYGALVFPAGKQSGVKLIWLRLLQYGSVLEGYDNAGMTWAGSLTAQNGGVASFGLKGRTTAGVSVDVAGTLSYASQESTMDASWIEPGFAGSIFGKATVSPAATNTPISNNVRISPTNATLNSTTVTQMVFNATGGNGTYSWSHNSSVGTLSATTGSSITYRYASAGNDTLTVTSDGKSASARITCQ